MKQHKESTKREKIHKSDAFTFADHVRELRRRAFWVALVFLGVSSAAYGYRDQLVQIVMAPLQGGTLVYLTPGGGFAFIFQITLYAGIIAAAPMLMYQLYCFMRPTLPSYAKRSAVSVASLAMALMVAGVTYGYFIAIPAALTFLSTFAGSNIIPNLTADSYLNFFLTYVGGLALLFQLPLLLIFWHWINPIKPGGLLKSERWMIVFAFIAAAIITPTPDVINQAMIAVPLVIVYQIGVVTVLVSLWKNRKRVSIIATPDTTKTLAWDIQPTVVTPPSQPITSKPSNLTPLRPIHRSVDGFGRLAYQPIQQPRSAVRHLAIPQRQAAAPQTSLIRRPLRIDGMSPL